MRTYVLLLSLLATLVAAAPASAGITIGSTNVADPAYCSSSGGMLIVPRDNPSYTVPEGGVLTSFSTNRPQAGGIVSMKVGFLFTDTFIVNYATPPVQVASAGVMTVPARFSVLPGMEIGWWLGDSQSCLTDLDPLNKNFAQPTPDPPIGFPIEMTQVYQGGFPALSARIEPDQDGDGWGDETQDSCPTQFAVHSGPCHFTLTTRLQVRPRRVGLGDSAQMLFTVTNTHPSALARNVRLDIGLPRGIRLFPATRSPCTRSGALSCSVSNLAAGESKTFTVSGRLTRRGLQRIRLKATALGDQNAASNASTRRIRVGKPVRCLVPRLNGVSLERARTLANRNGCVVGTVNFKFTAGKRLNKVLRVRARTGALLPLNTPLMIEVGS